MKQECTHRPSAGSIFDVHFFNNFWQYKLIWWHYYTFEFEYRGVIFWSLRFTHTKIWYFKLYHILRMLEFQFKQNYVQVFLVLNLVILKMQTFVFLMIWTWSVKLRIFVIPMHICIVFISHITGHRLRKVNWKDISKTKLYNRQ